MKGEGTLIVRGNIYIPDDLQYQDGKVVLAGDDPANPTGPRTFGVGLDLTKNALGLSAGGNIVIGDFYRPAAKQPDGSSDCGILGIGPGEEDREDVGDMRVPLHERRRRADGLCFSENTGKRSGPGRRDWKHPSLGLPDVASPVKEPYNRGEGVFIAGGEIDIHQFSL